MSAIRTPFNLRSMKSKSKKIRKIYGEKVENFSLIFKANFEVLVEGSLRLVEKKR